jgi:hypothetical protein
MVKTFETNDAGFQYVIDKKGTEDYNKHVATFREKSKKTVKLNECRDLLHNWLKYFRPGHIAVMMNEDSKDGKELSSDEIRQRYKNERKVILNEKEFINQFNNKKNRNPIEGIWSNEQYKIAIVPDEKNPGKFLGVVLKADSVYWLPGQIKIEITAKNSGYKANYYMRDHSKQEYTCDLPDTNCAVLKLNWDYWKRDYPKRRITAKEQLLIAFSKSRVPFVEQLSDHTLYLRIPSFANEQKRNIDSVLRFFDKQIQSMPNLIIDIRYGTGGSDASYANIIPYVYTNPIRSVGIRVLATEMNAKAFEKYGQNNSDSSSAKYCYDIAKKMQGNSGKFIDTDSENFSVDSSHKVLPFPKKVAIICNRYNGSTDEQFLIDVKQSRKVKVYGHSTMGCLDISNMNFVKFPDKRLTLGYCMSKSYRIPNYCIDGVGIQPDHFIDDNVSENDWIEYVRNEIEK